MSKDRVKRRSHSGKKKKRKQEVHSKKTRKIRKKYKLKKRIKKTKKKTKSNKLVWNILLALMMTTLLYVTIFFIFFSVGKMDGYSMLPNFGNSDVVAVSRTSQLKRFDLVYMETPGNNKENAVRRIIGMPGDEITFEEDELYVNGEGKSEKYLTSKKKSLKTMQLTDDFTLQELTGSAVVPKDSYFVLGDNRKSATDSRYYGFVSKEEVIGKVKMRIFPISKFKIY